MLQDEHTEEIFLAFIGAGDLVPSGKLLAALAGARTEAEMRAWYRRLVGSVANTAADPFEH